MSVCVCVRVCVCVFSSHVYMCTHYQTRMFVRIQKQVQMDEFYIWQTGVTLMHMASRALVYMCVSAYLSSRALQLPPPHAQPMILTA